MDATLQHWIDAHIRSILQKPGMLITDTQRNHWIQYCPEVRDAMKEQYDDTHQL